MDRHSNAVMDYSVFAFRCETNSTTVTLPAFSTVKCPVLIFLGASLSALTGLCSASCQGCHCSKRSPISRHLFSLPGREAAHD